MAKIPPNGQSCSIKQNYSALNRNYIIRDIFFQAYRIEPLILKHYSTVMPLPIHKYDTANKVPYQSMKSKAYAAFETAGSVDKLSEKGDKSESGNVNGMEPEVTGSADSSPSRQHGISSFS